MLSVLLSALLGAALIACGDGKTTVGCILPDSVLLQAGDVVFRRGSGMLSYAVMVAEGRTGVYSHVGIVADSGGVMVVVHAVPDEPDFEGDPDRVKMERPEMFFSSMRAVGGAVLRHRDSIAARRAAAMALAVYWRGVLFDHDYNDADTTSMYCTELVTFVFSRAGAPLKNVGHQRLPLPGLNYECVLPSDILHCNDFVLRQSF